MYSESQDKTEPIAQELRRFRIALEIMEKHPDILAEFKESVQAS